MASASKLRFKLEESEMKKKLALDAQAPSAAIVAASMCWKQGPIISNRSIMPLLLPLFHARPDDVAFARVLGHFLGSVLAADRAISAPSLSLIW